MPHQTQGSQGLSAKTAPGFAGTVLLLWTLPVLLGGCDAIYDDTKGWANRLEASILETAHELDEDPDAEEAAHYTPEVIEAPRRPQAAMAPQQPMPQQPPMSPVPPQAAAGQMAMLAPAQAEPEGAVADAASGLMLPAPGAKTPAKAKEDKKPDATAKGAAAKNDAKKPQKAEDKAAKAAVPPPPKPKPKPQMAAVPETQPAKEAANKPEGKPEEKPAQETPKAAEADNSHAMVLHLSSLRSEAAAKREWNALKRDFPVALGGLEAQIHRTELGDKGTFYRVLAGPLPSRTAAKEACAGVKARDVKQYCRVLPSPPTEKSPS